MNSVKDKVWLWRPKSRPRMPVLEDNYKCCFGKYSARLVFCRLNYVKMLIYGLFFLILVLRWFYSQLAGETFQNADNQLMFDEIFLVSIGLFGSILAISSLKSTKPIWTQFYLIYSTICLSIGIIWSLVTFYRKSGRFLKFSSSWDYQSFIEELFGWPTGYYYPNNQAHLAVASIISAFLACYFSWQLVLSFTFYHYVRDKQVELEEHGTLMSLRNRNGDAGYQLIPTWCWRPDNRLYRHPVSLSTHRSCCCPARTNFRITQTLHAVIFTVLLISALYGVSVLTYTNRTYILDTAIFLTYLLFVAIFGIFTTHKRAPFWTQVHMIFELFNLFVFGSLAVAALIFMTVWIIINLKDPRNRADIERITGIIITSEWIGLVVLILPLILIIVLLWNIRATYANYHYVRDRQLAAEEEHSERPTADSSLLDDETYNQVIEVLNVPIVNPYRW